MVSSEVVGLIAPVLVVTYNIRLGIAALRGSRKGPFV
jgi:hypothetical protein